MSRAGAMAARAQRQAVNTETLNAERSIVEGLRYLEREADRASLTDLAITIRTALTLYTYDRSQEFDA